MKENLKKMAGYYKPYMGIFLSDMFFAFLASVIALIIPLLVRYITQNLQSFDPQTASMKLVQIGAIMVALVLVQFGAKYYIAYVGHMMGARMEYNMRAEIFAHYQKLSFSFYDEQKVGQLMTRITNDLFEISELLHHGPENIALSLIKLIGAFVILFHINHYLTLAAFALVPVMLVYALYMNRKMKQAFRKNREKVALINTQIEDNLSGIRVVKSFANEAIEEEKFKVGNDAFIEAKRSSYFYMGMFHSGMNAFTLLVQVAVVVCGGILMTQGKVNVPDFIAFLLYINVFTEPIQTLIDFTEQFQNGYTGFERFLEILAVEPDIKDKENAEELLDVKGHIEFQDVSFKYKDTAHRVLRHIDLDVPAGAYMALVGTSGGGKTTLCSLIPRFYEVTKGRILIDGKDIRDVTMKSLRDNIGIVQQDVYLFAGTVMENISYGRPGATKEEIIEAAKAANAHDFIMELPNGYDTDIGQRGIKLSADRNSACPLRGYF